MSEYSCLSSEMVDDSMQSHDDKFAGKSQIHLELEKYIVDFKRPWFHSEVLVVGVNTLVLVLRCWMVPCTLMMFIFLESLSLILGWRNVLGFSRDFEPQRGLSRWCAVYGGSWENNSYTESLK
ncbi:hypothetical protein SUGI_0359140 [Cryptomeria japonica]|nr:hypothetical protein SUGI_0359140 [Cryptomeria japonica]